LQFSTASNNTAVGRAALSNTSSGANNTSLGSRAGVEITTGNYNTALGNQAGDNITTGSSNIIIGASVDAPSATASNQLNIGGWITGAAGAITVPGSLTTAGFTSTGIDDNATSTALTITNTGVEVKAGGTYSTASGNDLNIDIPSTRSLFIKNAGTTAMTIDNTGNVTVNTGNLVIGTSGKGIDFSADGNAGGMTSEVLDDYEEGTWTPTLDSGTNITYTSQSGRYTKIGGFVHCTAEIVVSNSNSDGSNIAISGLPYTGNSDEEAVNATLGRYIGFLGAKATAMRNVRFTGTSLLLMEGDNLAIAYNEIASSGTLQIAFTYTT
jgi:hypothetical protein